jgi:hypothetical protein
MFAYYQVTSGFQNEFIGLPQSAALKSSIWSRVSAGDEKKTCTASFCFIFQIDCRAVVPFLASP